MLFCSLLLFVKKVITFCELFIGGWTPTCGPWCFENLIFEKLKKSGPSVHILGKCSQVSQNLKVSSYTRPIQAKMEAFDENRGVPSHGAQFNARASMNFYVSEST